ncbi:MAG: hypothetical protein AB1Z65_05345 [Candidatus Sulfomarinibacteraceae bacterium]
MKRTSVIFVGLLLAVSLPALAQDFTHPATGTSNFSVTGTHNYYDSGGADCDGTGGQYSNNEDGVSVICPGTPGEFVTITFLDVDVETTTSASNCWDFVNIYDGNSTAAPLLISGCGEEGFAACSVNPGDGGDCNGVEGGPCDIQGSNYAAPANYVFTSTDATGCLTVEFTSDSSVDEGGWVAEVTAAVPVELMRFSVE